MPRLASGANTAERAPSAMSTCAALRCAATHRRAPRRRARCAAPRRRSPKRPRKRAASCGVSEISGTSTSARWPSRERRGDRAQIDLGLAGAGDAVQQERRVRAARKSARSPPAPPLAPRSRPVAIACSRRGVGERIVGQLARLGRDQPRLDERAHVLAGARIGARSSDSAIVPAAAMRRISPRFVRARAPPRAALVERLAPRARWCSVRAPRVDAASSTVTSPRSTSTRSALAAGSLCRRALVVRRARRAANSARALAVELLQRRAAPAAPTAPPPRASPRR